MTRAVIPANRAMWTPARALLIGGLTVGVLDVLDALVFFGLRGYRRCSCSTESPRDCWADRRSPAAWRRRCSASTRFPSTGVLVNGLLIHALGVGMNHWSWPAGQAGYPGRLRVDGDPGRHSGFLPLPWDGPPPTGTFVSPASDAWIPQDHDADPGRWCE